MTEVSTKDLAARARAVLAESFIHDLHDLQVDEHDGCLELSGLVSRFYYKQVAQELVLRACEEVAVVNSIRVRYSPR